LQVFLESNFKPNKTMNKNRLKYIAFATLCCFSTCKPQENNPQPVKPVADINTLVNSIPKISPLSQVVMSERSLGNPMQTAQNDSNGLPYICQEEKISLTNGMEQIIALNSNASSLFVGNIVQGKYVNDGILTSSSLTSQREDVTITITGLTGISNASRKVKPTLDQIEIARKAILASSSNIKVPAQITYKEVIGYSLAQSMLSFGINANWGAGSIGASFSNASKIEEKTVYIYFMQKYYDLSIDPKSPADFFVASTKVSDLQSSMQQGNPLCYVNSVAYGRILVAKITSKSSTDEITRAAKASYGLIRTGLGVSAMLSSSDKSVLSESNISVFVLGGDANDATAITANSTRGLDVMDKIASYMQNSASKPEFALPISYVVKYLDNTPFFVGSTTEYTKKDCNLSASATQKFELYFDSFYVNNDCDATGEGEFYYNISVKDTQNRDLITPISLPCNQQVTRGDKTAIILNRTISFELPKLSGQTFKVSATLYEDDTFGGSCSLTEREILTFDKNFNFPWDASNTTNAFDSQTGAKIWWVERVFPRVMACDVQLQYQIRLK
jgi:hypothetical protein